MRTRVFVSSSLIALLLLSTGCAGRKPAVVAGEAGLGLAQSIGQAQAAVKSLTDANLPAFPPERALKVQEALLKANALVGKLPPYLRVADAAEQAGQAAPGEIEKYLAILQEVGQALDLAIGDIPIGETAAQALKLTQEARKVAATISAELIKLRSRT